MDKKCGLQTPYITNITADYVGSEDGFGILFFLKEGDQVEVLEEKDGNLYGTRLPDGKQGWFPRNRSKRQQASVTSSPSQEPVPGTGGQSAEDFQRAHPKVRQQSANTRRCVSEDFSKNREKIAEQLQFKSDQASSTSEEIQINKGTTAPPLRPKPKQPVANFCHQKYRKSATDVPLQTQHDLGPTCNEKAPSWASPVGSHLSHKPRKAYETDDENQAQIPLLGKGERATPPPIPPKPNSTGTDFSSKRSCRAEATVIQETQCEGATPPPIPPKPNSKGTDFYSRRSCRAEATVIQETQCEATSNLQALTVPTQEAVDGHQDANSGQEEGATPPPIPPKPNSPGTDFSSERSYRAEATVIQQTQCEEEKAPVFIQRSGGKTTEPQMPEIWRQSQIQRETVTSDIVYKRETEDYTNLTDMKVYYLTPAQQSHEDQSTSDESGADDFDEDYLYQDLNPVAMSGESFTVPVGHMNILVKYAKSVGLIMWNDKGHSKKSTAFRVGSSYVLTAYDRTLTESRMGILFKIGDTIITLHEGPVFRNTSLSVLIYRIKTKLPIGLPRSLPMAKSRKSNTKKAYVLGYDEKNQLLNFCRSLDDETFESGSSLVFRPLVPDNSIGSPVFQQDKDQLIKVFAITILSPEDGKEEFQYVLKTASLHETLEHCNLTLHADIFGVKKKE